MIAIFIPTLYRPKNLPKVINSIYDTAFNECNIYAMCPDDDIESQEILDEYDVKFWTDKGDMRFAKRIQWMYRMTNESWFLTGADDLVFTEGWLDAAKPFMNNYSVISFEDNCNPTLPGTNFLIRRKYIKEDSGVVDSPNTVFCQEYFHNFVDNELWGTAIKRGVFAKCPGVIEHLHPTIGKAEWDDIYEVAQQNFHNDATLFHMRSHMWS